MSPVDQAVLEWAEKNPDEAPPAPAAAESAPGSTATPIPPQPEPARESAPDDEPSETALGVDEIAELGVTAIDFGLQNFVSQRCAFKPQQKETLVALAGKVVQKYLPDVEGAIEPEYAFVGAVALFAYSNYKSSPEPAKAGASPGGGSDGKNGASGGGSTTATVDGRPVDAEVLQ